MNKKASISIGVGSVIIIILAIVGFSNSGTSFNPSLELDFTYQQANSALKNSLEKNEISMSSPITLKTADAITQYCSFFEDETIQNMVEYCTSTELLDSDGNFLGNIHIVGTKKFPKIVLALVQVDPFMNDLPHTKSVFQNVIKDLVCNCWEDVKPSEISSVAEWVDKLREFHTSDVKPSSKSNLNLAGKQLQMEITTNTEGYLWKLLVSKSET